MLGCRAVCFFGTENARNLFVHQDCTHQHPLAGVFSCSARRVDAVNGRKLLTRPVVDGLMDVQEPSVAGAFGI